MSETPSNGFRVVVVGGGVAGLTLANALEVFMM
jgi:2-polyprenyl-6-methoxyphenol hydroxylase-like FAD-dependent oxidoreductase